MPICPSALKPYAATPSLPLEGTATLELRHLHHISREGRNEKTQAFTAYVQLSDEWWVAQLIEGTGVLVHARHLDQIKSVNASRMTLFQS